MTDIETEPYVAFDDAAVDAPEAILDWVAGYPGRAQEAYEAEQARSKPRAGLLADLEAVMAGGGPQ